MSLQERARQRAEEARKRMTQAACDPSDKLNTHVGQEPSDIWNGDQANGTSQQDYGYEQWNPTTQNDRQTDQYQGGFAQGQSRNGLVPADDEDQLTGGAEEGLESGGVPAKRAPDKHPWLRPKRREFICGEVCSRPVILGGGQVPSGAGRWLGSLFGGTPYARRRAGVAFTMRQPGGDGMHHVIAYGDTALSALAPGNQVRVRGKIRKTGELVADEVISNRTGTPVMQGRMSAARVRISTLLAVGIGAGTVRLARNLYVGATDAFARTAEGAGNAIVSLFSGAREAGIALFGLVVMFGLIMYSLYLLMGGKYR